MASILDILNTPKGEELTELIMKQTLESSEKISLALRMALPLFPKAMINNISKPQGLNSLNEALKEEKYEDLPLVDIKDQDPAQIMEEGSKIVDHIFGTNKNNITAMLGIVLQINKNDISDIFKISAPF